MKPWAWLASGTCLYLVSLAALAPARLLDAKLDEASAGHVRLVATTGTLWAGQGMAELRDQSGARRWAAPLAWRLRPGPLLLGRLDYQLATGADASLQALSVSRSRVELSGLDIRVPAASLAQGIPDMAPWGLAGELRLVSDRLGFGPGVAAGGMTLHWQAAGSALSPVSPLGDYALEVLGQEQGWQANLRTLAGPLQLSGQGAWRPGAPAQFEASAVVPPALRAELAPFLRLVASERGEGHFQWRLQ